LSDSGAYHHEIGISLVDDTQVAALIFLSLATVLAAGLAWRRRRPPAAPDGPTAPPGSQGERRLQHRVRSQERAARFYREQLLDRLNEPMTAFIGRQEMVWIAAP
jgi:hypothetical protein